MMSRTTKISRQTIAGQISEGDSLAFQTLESRQMLAFSSLFDGTTLTLNQTADDGIAIVDNNGPVNAFRVTDFSGVHVFAAAENIELNLLDGINGLNLNLDQLHAGDVTINLGNGDRGVSFGGAANNIGGDLAVFGGEGDQGFSPSQLNNLFVGGNLAIDMGQGNDGITPFHSVFVAGNATLNGINSFSININTFDVGGSLTFDSSNESLQNTVVQNGQLQVNGDLNYFGGSGNDVLIFTNASGALIGGNFTMLLGDDLTGAGQGAVFGGVGQIQGNVSIVGLSEISPESVMFDSTFNLQGTIHIDLGNGLNGAILNQTSSSASINYFGGTGIDQVGLGLVSVVPSNFNIVVGVGDDIVHLGATVEIDALLRVDFGGGNDTWDNVKGDFAWETRLLNLHGFSVFYYPDTEFLNLVQVAGLGNIALDNNGPGGRIHMDTDGTNIPLTVARNFRLNMLAGSQSDIGIDLNTSIEEDLTLDLKAGDRNVYFVGSSNEVTGNLRIEAGNGIQNIFTGESSELNVAGNLVINLRGGDDSIFDGGNAINVDGNYILRNVNQYEITAPIWIGGNFNFATLWEQANSRFDSDSTIEIAGNFSYLGGDGDDDVILENANVAGNVWIDVGQGLGPGTSQLIDLSNASILGHIGIRGATAVGGNLVNIDDNVHGGGNLTINFSNSTSNSSAIIRGAFDGEYGTYRGGAGQDNVELNFVALDMYFATILGGQDDLLTTAENSDLLAAYNDFGSGTDQFDDFRLNPYPMVTVNLP